MSKAPSYELLADVESASGDGPTISFSKGRHAPKSEYEETLLKAAVEAGYAKAPLADDGEDS